MTYKRFKQLWEALVTDRAEKDDHFFTGYKGMNKRTSDALIAYSKGDKTLINEAKIALSKLKESKS